MVTIYGIMPISAFILIFLLVSHYEDKLGKSYITSLLLWGVLISAATEGLSLIGALSQMGVLIFWISINLFFVWLVIRLRVDVLAKIREIYQALLDEGIILIPVIIISVITLVIALLSPPNFWDGLTYHMSRVAHWAQNGSINHYITNDARQLVFPPFPEFVILHFYLLMGTDLFANLLQWFSMVSSAIIVYLLAKQLGGKQFGRSFAVIVAITIPFGILQATSVQSDYILAMWLGCFVYLILENLYSNQIRNILLIGIALGLAIFTKSHAYIFGLPFAIWYGFTQIKKNQVRAVRNAAIIVVIILIINMGHYTRNIIWFDSPLAVGTRELGRSVNGRFGIDVTVSNMIRNASFHMGTNLDLSLRMTKAIMEFHEILGLDVNDPDTTEQRMRFGVVPIMPVESMAGSPFHFLLIVMSFVLVIIHPKLRKNSLLVMYVCFIVLAYVLLSSYLNWTVVSARHQLTLFILASPVIGVVFETMLKKFSIQILSFGMLILAIPYLFGNYNRPIVPMGGFTWQQTMLNSNRLDIYFFQNRDLQPIFMDAAEAISNTTCNHIGIRSNTESFEYLLWITLAETGEEYTISHITDEMQAPDTKTGQVSGPNMERTCVIVYLQDSQGYYPKIWEIEGTIIYQSPTFHELPYLTVSWLK